jgi:hypothetical protein
LAGSFGASVKQFSSGIPHSREFWAMVMIVDAWLASANTRVGYPPDGLPSLLLDHDSWPLSEEGNLTTEKSFRLPWLRDDDAPAT